MPQWGHKARHLLERPVRDRISLGAPLILSPCPPNVQKKTSKGPSIRQNKTCSVQSWHFSMYLFIYIFIYLFIYLFIYIFIYIFIYLFIYLLIYPFLSYPILPYPILCIYLSYPPTSILSIYIYMLSYPIHWPLKIVSHGAMNIAVFFLFKLPFIWVGFGGYCISDWQKHILYCW